MLHSHVYSLWIDLSVRTKNFDLVTLTFDLLLKKLNLRHAIWIQRDKAFRSCMDIPCGKTFLPVPKFFYLVNLTSNLDLLLKKKDKAFILRMCIPCVKTFLSLPNFYPVTLTSNHDLLLKKFNLCINFCTEREPKRLQKLGGRGLLVPLGQPRSSFQFVVT